MTVCSTEEDYDLCMELGLNPVMHPNNPVGRKHNLGLESAFKRDWSRMILMGSDDLLSNEAVDTLINADTFHCGFRQMIAYDTKSGAMLKHEYLKNTRIIGAGRMIHRQALEDTHVRTNFFHRLKEKRIAAYSNESREISMRTGKHLENRGAGLIRGRVSGAWDNELNRNLDNSLDANLSLCGFAPVSLESDKIPIIDLKSEANLNGMGGFHLQEGKVTKYDGDWDWFLSDEEKTAVAKLRKA